jgi:sterol desaturase/sphingolipid hydroxylase (fatty acid hydroxylase superfamily)
MSHLIHLAIPVFILSMIVEGMWAARATRANEDIKGYERRDTAASILMGLGNVIIALGTKVVVFAVMTWLYAHRLVTLPVAWWTWLLLLVAEDFCYYWFHRTSHEVRFFWAAHVNHHSSEKYNLSTALRQSWTTPFTSPIFWLPLPLLGFPPWMVLTQQAVSLLYQFWIHTESIKSLGPLEWVFNTPSHHRVHHGSNEEYLDKNHGGIFIVWDRLFGTFEPEKKRVVYGLTKNIETFHLVKIAFHEWAAIARDVRGARSLGEALRYVFGAPGWRPAGAKSSPSTTLSINRVVP